MSVEDWPFDFLNDIFIPFFSGNLTFPLQKSEKSKKNGRGEGGKEKEWKYQENI